MTGSPRVSPHPGARVAVGLPQHADLVVDGRPASAVVAESAGESAITPSPTVIPGDKSISHRALLMALLSERPLEIENINLGKAVRVLLDPLRMLGFTVDVERSTVRVRPSGASVAPMPWLYVDGSSAAARLLLGVLAGKGLPAVVDGDEVLRNRPMDWVVEPLRKLGARLEYLAAPGRLPVAVHGGVSQGGQIDLEVGSAQAHSAVLLAAVAAQVPVTMRRPARSRDHTERLLAHFGINLVMDRGVLHCPGGQVVRGSRIRVPADPSLAAYLVALRLRSGSGPALRIADVCLNPTRIGFFQVLRAAGADIRYTDITESHGEPVGTIVAAGDLAGVGNVKVADPDTFHSLLDEIPLLLALAASLPGPSRVTGAEELAFKETDRIVTTAGMLTDLGARATCDTSSITVAGGEPLRAGRIRSYGDHRIAMAAATVAATLPGSSTIVDGCCYDTSFPEFVQVMARLGARIRMAENDQRGRGER